MKKINPILILLSILSIGLGAKAQVNYTYDNNGNRIHRELYVGPPLGERSFSPNPTTKDLPAIDELATHRAIDFGISIFPTNVSDVLSITILAANENTPALVEVFDNLGKSVYTKKVNSSTQGQINFSSIKNGMYNIKVSIKNQNVFYKVVKGS
jgi:hypothetical protein